MILRALEVKYCMHMSLSITLFVAYNFGMHVLLGQITLAIMDKENLEELICQLHVTNHRNHVHT